MFFLVINPLRISIFIKEHILELNYITISGKHLVNTYTYHLSEIDNIKHNRLILSDKPKISRFVCYQFVFQYSTALPNA